MRHIQLTKEERLQLEELYKTTNNRVKKNRSRCLLLSDEGFSMCEVSRITNVGWLSIVRLFNAWELASPDDRFSTLGIAAGRGAKIKLASAKNLLSILLDEHKRDLNEVLFQLKKEHNIKVCKATLKKYIENENL